MDAKNLLKSLVVFLIVYPAALLVQLGLDTYMGDMTFADRWLYGSKRRLLETILMDWLHSSIWVLPVMLIAYGLLRIFPKVGAILAVTGISLLLVLLIYSTVLPQMLCLTTVFALAASLFLRKVAAI